jgi:lysophospholipase L1-like esterase
MPAALYSGDRAQDINLCRSGGWRSDYVGRSDGRGDGLLGFAGASVSSGAPHDFAWVETTRSNPEGRLVSRFDIFSLGQPQGGTLLVEVDGGAARAISTRQAEPGLLWHRVELPEGPHRLSLRPMGDGEVRLLGLLAEREGGVVVDAMGVRGKQVRSWSSWEESLAGPGIAALNPDVAVLAYGTNEAHDSSFEAGRLREDMLFAIGRLRRWAPAAACVLVGPTDAAAQKGRTWVVKGRTRAVAEVQRQVAIEAGCLFWDWQAAMGGEGASVLGRLLEPPLYSSDYIHLSREGYERSAERLLEALDEAAGWPPTSP